MYVWNKDSVASGLEKIAECRELLLAELAGLINQFNGCEKSEHYYDIIAGDWLEQFLHVVYSAMVGGSEKKFDQRLYLTIPVTADIRAYGMSCQSSGLHQHLRAAVAHLLGGGSPSALRFAKDSAQIASGGKQRLAEKALRVLATKLPELLLVGPYFKCGKTEAASTLLSWRRWAALDSLHYPVNISLDLDAPWRMNRACAASPANDLLGVLRVLLPLHLPVALLEGFVAYRNAVLAMPVARPRAVYSANSLFGHLTFKLLAAEWRQEGTPLLYHQHGGGYGIDRVHVCEQFESRVADRYYTWGWHAKGNQKIRPLYPAALDTPNSKKKFVLLSCVDFPEVVYRIHFHPMPGKIQTMQRETCEFLAALPDRRELLVRPYTNDYSGKFVGLLHRAAPDAAFDDRRTSAMRRFAQSRLVVHNYLGTGYLETLALNIPTVCFYDPDTYAFRAEAEPIMEALARVGILHFSGKAAACFVAGFLSDPDGWWSKPEVQLARQEFVERYACFSSDWKRHWETEFRSAIEESA
jgi:putative transferase (TIGR04331 family)